MSQIYFAFIIFPIIFMTLMGFTFSSISSDFKSKLFLLNCPYPIEHGVAYNIQILGNNGLPDPKGTIIQFLVNYTQSVSPSNSTQGTFFNCTIDTVTGNHQVNTIIKSYGMVQFGVPMGQITFYTDTLGAQQGKGSLVIQAMRSAIDAPSQVTALSWYGYVNIILMMFIVLGVIMIIVGAVT